ncbi:hypothetical protein HAX54_039779 [Datura stramonium]|uniref:Uncharacterized protein n=1 Tax=Datura stramonium TaxID=4076 RepID=A0ABS8VQ75_DATST|nr:hypothetical protein [Datura stramonium]
MTSPVMDRSPPNDWFIGYNLFEGVAARVVQVGDQPRFETPLALDDGHPDDLYRVALISSYYEAKTFLDRWVMTSSDESLVLLPGPVISSIAEITLRHYL